MLVMLALMLPCCTGAESGVESSDCEGCGMEMWVGGDALDDVFTGGLWSEGMAGICEPFLSA